VLAGRDVVPICATVGHCDQGGVENAQNNVAVAAVCVRRGAEGCPMLIKSWSIIAIGSMLTVTGCATQYAPEHMSDPYGFLSGILHGFLFPFALMGKLLSWILSLFGVSFLDSVTIIGRPNTGFFYYFGFVLGLGMTGGGAGASQR
jgi:hypothetical protein